jgi:hypothetical protein
VPRRETGIVFFLCEEHACSCTITNQIIQHYLRLRNTSACPRKSSESIVLSCEKLHCLSFERSVSEGAEGHNGLQVVGWLQYLTLVLSKILSYESTKVLQSYVYSTKVLSYFRTFVRISIKVVIQLQYVVLSYLRSILFLSSYGSTKVRKYNYSRKYHTSVRVLHSVHFAGFTVSRGYGGHTTVRCTRTCTVQ